MPSITVEPCTFALFGALGDLALRKLFPALYQLDRTGLLHADTRILALAREPGDALTHLARIVGVPTIALYGPGNPQISGPAICSRWASTFIMSRASFLVSLRTTPVLLLMLNAAESVPDSA